MKATAASTRMESICALFDMQTTFFKRAIEGVSDKDAYNRLQTEANHIAWLAGTIVQQRFLMVSETNPELKSTGDDLFKNHQGIKDGVSYPSLAQYVSDWERVTPFSRQALLDITNEKLDSEIDMGGMKMSYYELITFTIYREASCIGQLALWRRLLGYPAMRYD